MNTPTNAREQLGNAAREEAGRAGAAADDAGDVGRLVVGRRRISSLGLFVAAAAIAPGATTPARAAYESQTQGGLDSPGNAAPAAPASTELSLYKRSFRERFETSISAGTHDYGFKYPKETWKPDIVSLNDGKLYGVDLRFSSPAEGKLCTHVLPFVDADSLTDVGSPEVVSDFRRVRRRLNVVVPCADFAPRDEKRCLASDPRRQSRPRGTMSSDTDVSVTERVCGVLRRRWTASWSSSERFGTRTASAFQGGTLGASSLPR